MMRALRFILPVVIVALASAGAWWMVRSRSVPEPQPRELPPPLVRVTEARRVDRLLTVTTQGTVAPRTEVVIAAEVAGRVVEVSPSLVAGGFFEDGQLLLALDPRDYELAVVRARAEVSRAELLVAREEAEAKVAREEWAELGEGEAGPLVSRELQVEQARSALASARAALTKAELDLQRTRVNAPFAGRVRRKNVDLGQFVGPGAPLAEVYAVDAAEVRLPLSTEEMAYLDLPLDHQGEDGPEVVLRTRFAGQVHAWSGRVVRVESEIDPQTRLVHAVARVAEPYRREADDGRPPLASGLFVEAEIQGRLARDVVVLPRSALRGRDRVLVIDDDQRLRFREVEVLRASENEVVIRSGLVGGETVCLSPLEAAVEGMRVRVETGLQDTGSGPRDESGSREGAAA